MFETGPGLTLAQIAMAPINLSCLS